MAKDLTFRYTMSGFPVSLKVRPIRCHACGETVTGAEVEVGDRIVEGLPVSVQMAIWEMCQELQAKQRY